MQNNKPLPLSKIWTTPELVVISSDKQKIEQEILDRLKRRNIQKVNYFTTISEGFQYASKKLNTLVLTQGSSQLSVYETVTHIISDPTFLLTPNIFTTGAIDPKKLEYFKDLHIGQIITTPYTPGSFIDQIEVTLRRWSIPSFTKLIVAKMNLLQNNYLDALKTMLSVASDTNTLPITVPCLSLLLKERQGPKSIEKIILSGLKSHPRNLLMILNAANFYLRVAMPETSLKVLEASKRFHGQHELLLPAELQAHLLLNDIPGILDCLKSLMTMNYKPQITRQLVLKTLFAEGHKKDFFDIYRDNELSWETLEAFWQKPEFTQSA